MQTGSSTCWRRSPGSKVKAEESMSDTPKTGEKKYWLDEKKNVDKVWYGVIAICAITVICDFFYHKHVEYAAEDFIPGMYGWYGFIACVFLVLSAKVLRKIVMRSEDYYKDRDD
jgi:hypothetical protein